ncbi:hypothetical protein H0H93_003528 [Arthromyces matolae]|nr:hypothetical protein H0H93_003528 [Arthromyces matolae]
MERAYANTWNRAFWYKSVTIPKAMTWKVAKKLSMLRSNQGQKTNSWLALEKYQASSYSPDSSSARMCTDTKGDRTERRCSSPRCEVHKVTSTDPRRTSTGILALAMIGDFLWEASAFVMNDFGIVLCMNTSYSALAELVETIANGDLGVKDFGRVVQSPQTSTHGPWQSVLWPSQQQQACYLINGSLLKRIKSRDVIVDHDHILDVNHISVPLFKIQPMQKDQPPYPGPTPNYGEPYPQQPAPGPPPAYDQKSPYEGDRFKPKRTINDPIFLIFFVLQLLGFAALSGIVINTWISSGGLGGGLGQPGGQSGTSVTLNRSTAFLLLLITAAALLLSVIYLLLTRAFTTLIMHITLVLTIMLNIGICVYYWITQYWSGAIIFTIIALLSIFAYFGFRSRIPLASLLLQVVMDVAEHHKSVYVVAFIALLIQSALAVKGALYGKPYIPAAKDTWRLFKDRGIDALINDSLVGMTLTWGAYAVGLVSSLFAYLYLRFTAPSYNADGNYTAPVLLFSFLIGLQCYGYGAKTFASFVGLGEDPQVLAQRAPDLFGVSILIDG